MLKIKKGFTLAEVLIAIVLIGVIAVITIPTLLKSRPNKNKAMFRKAYHLTERVTAELKSNETLYPEADDHCGRYFAYDLKDASGNLDTRYRISNFVTNFANQIDTQGSVNLGNRPLTWSNSEGRSKIEPANIDNQTFKTTDGIKWYFNTSENEGFCDPQRMAYKVENGILTNCKSLMPYPNGYNEDIQFVVDVNGNKGPNAFVGEAENPDRFIIQIKYNGKVSVPHSDPDGTSPSTEEQYLQSTTIM